MKIPIKADLTRAYLEGANLAKHVLKESKMRDKQGGCMSHTPGPWVVDDDRKARKSRKSQLSILMVVAKKGGMPGLIVNQPPVVTETDEANARLIAAAPDMKDALRSARTAMGAAYDCVVKGRYDEALLYLGGEGARITRALANATGEKP